MRALVTGGSRGIGRSICLKIANDALARGEEARIVVSATGASPDLHAVVAELKALGAQALAVTGDLNDPAEPKRLVEEAIAFCGGLDSVVHNAGGAIASPLVKASVEDWMAVFSINCHAFLWLAQAANRALRESKGSMVAIGSASAERVHPYLSAYPPAKAALKMLMGQLAYEWGKYGIRINMVSPGLTMSRSTEDAMSSEEDQARAGSYIPMKRIGFPEDVANIVGFLVGPDAAYLTGENINIDGGGQHMGAEAQLNDDPGKWTAHDAGRMKPKDG